MATRSYTHITPQIVEKTKRYLNDDRNFSMVEVAKLMGISLNSVKKIRRGEYDEPKVDDIETIQKVSENTKNITEIPYDQLKYLIKCECFISEMFGIAVTSDKDEDELYFPRHYLNAMCDRYFPGRKEETLERLKDDTNA